MSRVRPEDIEIQFSLFHDERDLIVENALALDPGLTRRLLFGEVQGPFLVYTFSVEDFEALLDALATETDHARTRALRHQFAEVYERLSAPPMPASEGDVGDDLPDTPMKAEFKALINQAVEEGGGRVDMDKLNKKLEALSEKYNHMPSPEFEGLSPTQVARLLYVEWGMPDSAIVLNENLTFADLQQSAFLTNARILLSAIAEAGPGGVRATGMGYLNRKFVAQMIQAMTLPERLRDDLKRYYKIIDEDSVRPLYSVSLCLTLSGLVRVTKGHFICTRKGKAMLPESAAGTLYAMLFKTFFQKLSIASMERGEVCPELQDSVPYSLYVLQRRADNWCESEQSSPQILLPMIHRLAEHEFFTNRPRVLTELRIIRPLQEFGLLDLSGGMEADEIYSMVKRYRKTPLFDRFLSFRLDDSWTPPEP